MNDSEFLTRIQEAGLVSDTQVKSCLAAQRTLRSPLWKIAVEKGFLTRDLAEQLRDPDAMPSVPFGPYILERKIGEGAMGVVYLARKGKAGAPVALKILPMRMSADDDMVRRFKREAEIAVRVNHPNVIRGRAFGEVNDRWYFEMEYAPGKGLGSTLKRKGKLTVRDSLDIVMQITRALDAIHRMGAIHRDVKPDNVMLLDNGSVKLMDLGLAKITAADMSSLTAEGTIVGTPFYMPPEQIRGDSQVDIRGDIYSLGATLYYMLTGVQPFEGESVIDVMQKHLKHELLSPTHYEPKLAEPVVHVLEKMMAFEARHRYSDPARLLQDLERVHRGERPAAERLDAGKSLIGRRVPKHVAHPVTERIGTSPSKAPTRRMPTSRMSRRITREPRRRYTTAIVLGAAVALVVLAVLLIPSRSRRPRSQAATPTAEPEPELPRVSGPVAPTVVKEEEPKTVEAWESVVAFEDREDVGAEEVLSHYRNVRKQFAGTPWEKECRARIDAWTAKVDAAIDEAAGGFAGELGGLIERKEFGKARDLVNEARTAFSSERWTEAVNRQDRRVEDALTKIANELRGRKAWAELAQLGVPALVSEADWELAKEKELTEAREAELARILPEERKRISKTWSEAATQAAARKYGEATGLLRKLRNEIRHPDARKDLEGMIAEMAGASEVLSDALDHHKQAATPDTAKVLVIHKRAWSADAPLGRFLFALLDGDLKFAERELKRVGSEDDLRPEYVVLLNRLRSEQDALDRRRKEAASLYAQASRNIRSTTKRKEGLAIFRDLKEHYRDVLTDREKKTIQKHLTAPSDDWVKVQGAPKHWAVVGPFRMRRRGPPGEGRPEHSPFNPKQTFEGSEGQTISWNWHKADAAGKVELQRIIGGTYVVGYAVCRIRADRAGPVTFRVNSDDGFRLWVNGEDIDGQFGEREYGDEARVSQGQLRAGENIIMIKVRNGAANWAFRVGIQTSAGLTEYPGP